MYVCVYVYVYVCMCVCICMYVCIYVCIYMYVYYINVSRRSSVAEYLYAFYSYEIARVCMFQFN